MTVRAYHSEDLPAVAAVFYDAVHSVDKTEYTKPQLDAWAPEDMDVNGWDDRLSNQYTLVAEKDGVLAGFGSMDGTGYLDLLYVRGAYQRMGAASRLLAAMETEGRCRGVPAIVTAASRAAKLFFEKRGYRVQEAQTVGCRGQRFVNFKMRKDL
ncbi:MAG: GNAT family N-acetyltransferase [Oscillospiraceae bacterium]|jgi:putative acetyltransferase|nr:GNAT family N-acetyltransferase [Oscillospiraceae bacterium]